ncbi:MAG: GMC family oxidoreductase, partial [Beijerinckiaceae bacterium]|nr:GMC family oxidoreductase [Beijerinckiaceae bacterium]
YVIAGSGAGGGTLAARLAEAGKSVFLLEAGGDPNEAALGLPEQYDVPAFHPLASENPAMSWRFFPRHNADDRLQKADWKCEADPLTGEPGIFYPRAGTLGGCTAHNAMIFVAPNNSDWDYIAKLTGDPSWRAQEMRKYFRLVENCRHRRLRRLVEACRGRPLWRWLYRLFGSNPAGHGWEGWLPAERALPRRIRDFQLCRMFASTALTIVFKGPSWGAGLRRLMKGEADPNDMRRLGERADGLCYTPLSTDWHRRKGTRERLLEIREKYPDRLHIELNALATKVVFDSGNRAIGVEYLKGDRLYRAHHEPSIEPGERREVRAAREVILAGGAFNTPQLLMLSGIGPREVLDKWRDYIPAVKVLEGVGQNLQDRYEVAIVYRMRKPWSSLRGAKFRRGDRLYEDWSSRRKDWHGRGGGMYTANGAAIAFSLRSSCGEPDPNLFCMALLAPFKGYYTGYSKDVCDPGRLDCLTWAVLKAYSGSRGSVTLESPDPRDRPKINFRYFEETDAGSARKDVDAVLTAIKFIRKITSRLKSQGLIGGEEEFPGEGPGFPGEGPAADKELARHVRDTAWGHHASCTCRIGPESEGGVLSNDFKVHGTTGLRVVDASVFPRIPGFFIASAIYMIAEKAADVILREAEGDRDAK